mmetsp:Transcript_89725/g.187427  ORF Transcript_89725/g.187427 Transcript_89725/m.187427 type:complete len:499 (-) Transcript_89725:10-1506(-)
MSLMESTPSARSRSSSFSLGSLSMPGSIRRAKTKCFGPTKMANDPLAVQRSELASYDAVLNTLQSSVRLVEQSVGMLVDASNPLANDLNRFFPKDVPGGCAVGRMLDSLRVFGGRIRQANTHIEQIQALISEQATQNAGVREAFKARDIAWQTSSHYEIKVGNLQEQVGRGSMITQRLNDKLQRNLLKKQESDKVLQAQMEGACDVSNRALSTKYQRTAEVLTKLCRYYIQVFEAATAITPELRDVVKEFTGPSATEAMAQSGKEMAAKAKQQLGNFSQGLKDQFSSMKAKSEALYTGSAASTDAVPGNAQSDWGAPPRARSGGSDMAAQSFASMSSDASSPWRGSQSARGTSMGASPQAGNASSQPETPSRSESGRAYSDWHLDSSPMGTRSSPGGYGGFPQTSSAWGNPSMGQMGAGGGASSPTQYQQPGWATSSPSGMSPSSAFGSTGPPGPYGGPFNQGMPHPPQQQQQQPQQGQPPWLPYPEADQRPAASPWG